MKMTDQLFYPLNHSSDYLNEKSTIPIRIKCNHNHKKLTSPDDCRANRIDRQSTVGRYPPVPVPFCSPCGITASSTRKTISTKIPPSPVDFPAISFSSFPWCGRFVVFPTQFWRFSVSIFFLRIADTNIGALYWNYEYLLSTTIFYRPELCLFVFFFDEYHSCFFADSVSFFVFICVNTVATVAAVAASVAAEKRNTNKKNQMIFLSCAIAFLVLLLLIFVSMKAKEREKKNECKTALDSGASSFRI